MDSKQVFSLDIPFDTEYVQLARLILEDLARTMPFNQQDIDDMKTAVGEACTNAVRHGCSRPRQPHVNVRYTKQSHQITVQVRNATHPGTQPRVPESAPCTESEGGYGLFIMHQLMDRVRIAHTPRTAVVTMTKRLRS